MDRAGDFVYCSNRGYNTMAVFRVLKGGEQEGQLEQVSLVSIFGQTPRHFAISPGNRFLVGANQDSNNRVFRRHLDDGSLSMLKVYTQLDFADVDGFEFAAPNFVLFAPQTQTQTHVQAGSYVVYTMLALLLAILVGVAVAM